MRVLLNFACGTAVFAAAVASMAARSATRPQQPELGTVLQEAAAYLDGYQKRLATVIAEETYQMTGPFGSGGNIHLASDILLIGTGDNWVEFRDVYEYDGRLVRDHEARLEALLGGPDVLDKAQRIADESARYNGSLVPRNINVPTMALLYLTGANQARSSFTLARTGKTVVVEFQEMARPALIHASVGNIATSGRFWIDAQSGAILKSELSVKQEGKDIRKTDPIVVGTITVSYAEDPKLGFLVPHEMTEQYDRPALVKGLARYSNYKSFGVVVNTKTGRGGHS